MAPSVAPAAASDPHDQFFNRKSACGCLVFISLNLQSPTCGQGAKPVGAMMWLPQGSSSRRGCRTSGCASASPWHRRFPGLRLPFFDRVMSVPLDMQVCVCACVLSIRACPSFCLLPTRFQTSGSWRSPDHNQNARECVCQIRSDRATWSASCMACGRVVCVGIKTQSALRSPSTSAAPQTPSAEATASPSPRRQPRQTTGLPSP